MEIPTGSYVTAVLTRDVRDLADLGNGSRSLGLRWEEVGGGQVVSLVGQDLRSPSGELIRCAVVQRLDDQVGLLSEASGRGLKSPDCLFAGHDRLGRFAIMPGDFKFTLDVATRDQIDASPIRALVERGGPRFQALLSALLSAAYTNLTRDNAAAALLDALDGGTARLLPGLFLSPDEPTNRLYLKQFAGRRRNAVTEADVRFLPVDTSFFHGLPGTEITPLLMEIDGVNGARADFPAATYYFQLGAAVRGALSLLHRPLLPLLGEEPPLDASAALRRHLAKQPAMWAIDVARQLATPAIQRRERMRLAQRLMGTGLRGRVTYEVIESLGLTVADEPGPGIIGKGELKGMHAAIDEAHLVQMQHQLALRLADGPLLDDEAVLAWLRDLRPSIEQWARAALAERLTELTAARTRTTGEADQSGRPSG